MKQDRVSRVVVSEAECQRSTRIAGTKGELIGNMDSFVSAQSERSG